MRNVLMNTALALAVTSVLLTSALTTRAQGQTQSAASPLTNASVVKLVRAGFSEKTVIAIIRTRPSRFDLSPERLIELKKGGVGEKIILAMLARDADVSISAATDDWDADEPFFKDGTAGGGAKGQTDPNEVNIFGSSGGSRGKTRTQGLNGGSEGETQTTGSATVRILRPPAESGGVAAAKIERTPTLTNESVVELVEAGFSEGTIIRRIELSPAEYDLAPEKLGELRKRRVSEPIIAAMRQAMSDDEPASRPEN